jgi:hypothetical protein
MANDDAWQAGIDIANNKKHNRKGKNSADKQGGSTGTAGASGGGNPWSILSYLPRLHKGGRVKKTGGYLLRKGEIVLTKKQQKSVGIKQGGKKSTRKRVSGKA